MKEIQLTQGKVALVDDEDFEYLNQFKWRASKDGQTFYAIRNLGYDNKTRSMHRDILNLKDPKIIVDHKDHDGLNNQRSNIRVVSFVVNAINRRHSGRDNYRGVQQGKGKTIKWMAYISLHSKARYLGTYDTPEQAAIAYDASARKMHGEFAILNFPNSQ